MGVDGGGLDWRKRKTDRTASKRVGFLATGYNTLARLSVLQDRAEYINYCFILHRRCFTRACQVESCPSSSIHDDHQHTQHHHTPHSMSEGLSRRRGRAGSGSNGQAGSSANGPSSSGGGGPSTGQAAAGGSNSLSPTMDGSKRGSSSNNSSNSNTGTLHQTAGGGSGHKIAYDPLDLETRSEEAELPKLTLMEEIILLGIKEWGIIPL
jgi:hypothetical protein